MSIEEEFNKAKEDLNKAEKLQALMKSANKIVKRKNVTNEEKITDLMRPLMDLQGRSLGNPLTRTQAIQILTPDYANRIGFPGYELTSINGKIKRLRSRIAELTIKRTAEATGETKEWTFDGGTVENNYEADRIQIFFDQIPDADQRTKLKRVSQEYSLAT